MPTVWGSRITNDAGCTREIKSMIDIAKAALKKDSSSPGYCT